MNSVYLPSVFMLFNLTSWVRFKRKPFKWCVTYCPQLCAERVKGTMKCRRSVKTVLRDSGVMEMTQWNLMVVKNAQKTSQQKQQERHHKTIVLCVSCLIILGDAVWRIVHFESCLIVLSRQLYFVWVVCSTLVDNYTLNKSYLSEYL